MSTVFNDGSHVDEIFASKFKTLVNGLAITNKLVSFRLNQQDAQSVTLSCDHAFTCDYLNFMNALDSEILAFGIAIVVAIDYRENARENTVYIVCDDEL